MHGRDGSFAARDRVSRASVRTANGEIMTIFELRIGEDYHHHCRSPLIPCEMRRTNRLRDGGFTRSGCLFRSRREEQTRMILLES